MTDRNLALDYLRAFVTVLVLAFHSFIAYGVYIPSSAARFDTKPYLWGPFPIVDRERWLGFDLFIVFNDIFFMSLMFLLSGLFVWPSLVRKGSGRFLRDRVLRLGLPFAVVVTFLMPLAYYPAYRVTGADPDFSAYWGQWLALDYWPFGPCWFVALLLAFACVAAGLFRFDSRWGNALGRLSSFAWGRPTAYFLGLVVVSVLAYLPLRLAFGPTQWFVFGPFGVQASRLLLYAVYFFAGVGIGAYGMERGLLASDGQLARRWVAWLVAALLLYALVVASMILSRAAGGETPTSWQTLGPASLGWQIAIGLAFVLSCGASGFFFLALFVRFVGDRGHVLDSLRDNAYGMYLIHYVFVVWLQYSLLHQTWPAILKAAIVFAGTLLLSWSTIAAIRRIPVVRSLI